MEFVSDLGKRRQLISEKKSTEPVINDTSTSHRILGRTLLDFLVEYKSYSSSMQRDDRLAKQHAFRVSCLVNQAETLFSLF